MRRADNLNINSENVCFLITCAQEFQSKEAVTFPEQIENSDYEYDPLQILADHQDDMTFLSAKKAIEDLEPDQQVELLALMYLGRGDFEIDEWDRAKKEAFNNMPAEGFAEYLFAKPELPYYLSRALEMWGLGCDT